ncbi:hypothetical protein H633G_11444 [Metarhizium anisopliae BRIP 53284]|nr:hypothetical protein H633G_11444 [Metarhizium anisopliae BRIP 53284]
MAATKLSRCGTIMDPSMGVTEVCGKEVEQVANQGDFCQPELGVMNQSREGYVQ